MSKYLLLTVMVLLLFSSGTVAQDTCLVPLQTILEEATASCSDTPHNAACYGGGQIDVSLRDDAGFVEPGDTIDLNVVESLTTAPYDNATDEWGVVILVLQADPSGDLPDSTVNVIAFGDVTIENAIDVPVNVTATTTANARSRRIPQVDNNPGNIITSVPQGSTLQALGRGESGTWLFLDLDIYANRGFDTAWISTQVLSVNGDVMSLPVVSENSPPPVTTPMSTFYLQTGDSSSGCEAIMTDGVLIETLDDVERVQFTVNGVVLTLSDTAYLRVAEDALEVYILEGHGLLSVGDENQPLPAGVVSRVPLSDDGREPASGPSAPQPYDSFTADALLPIVESGALNTMSVATPLPEVDIPAAIEAAFAPYGLFDGRYLSNGSRVCDAYYERRQFTSVSEFRVEADRITLIAQASTLDYVLGGDGRYYYFNTFSSDTSRMADGTQLQTTYNVSNTLTVISPTEFMVEGTMITTEPTRGTDMIADGGFFDWTCTSSYTYTWLGP
jgi:hypothetical protein